ncbi:MAG TPA: CocE/NonD family hydrolase [Steroidobacteraceae bacterium]
MPSYEPSLPHAVEDIENVWITLSDGCRLAARLWLPDGGTRPVPAILEYIPYRKRDFMRRRDEGMHHWFAGHGYAAVRVDMRGSGESDGILHDEYLAQEQDDALEVIGWIARQPWCSGNVGMMGKSWGAYNSLQVAARRPPALKAVIAVMGTDDRFAECIHYSGGCLLNDNFWWGCVMQIFNARPPDPAIVGERWRAMWLERLEAERFWPELWLEHQALDDYWKHGSVCFDYGAIQCPTWFWGGWADLYRDTPLRLAEHLRVPHRVTVGPWAHLYPHEAIPAPAVGFLQEALRWWDHWLKGRDLGVMSEAPFNFYMMDAIGPQSSHAARAGRWIAEERWPSPNVSVRTFTLNAHGLEERPGERRPLTLRSPQSTGLASGDWGSFGNPGDVPGDQREDSSGSLEFTGAPLPQRLEILGNSRAVLELSSDQPDAFVAVRLIDVAPDGEATCVARGFLNLTHRDGREAPKPLVPGERYRVEVPLTGTAYAFPAGHRMRLALSSAYWPIVWPSPASAMLTLIAGSSQLLLPVRAAEAPSTPPVEMPEPVCAEPSRATVLRQGRVERSVTTDPVTGEVNHRLYVDGGVFGDWGKFRLEAVDLEMGHVFERNYRIRPDQPNSARATMTQSYEMARGDWQVKINAGAEMTSTPQAFELTAWLEALEGDTVVCRRDWRSSIPRRQV